MIELTPKAQREMEEAWNLRRECVTLLGHVVAEWDSDPQSVACEVLKRLKQVDPFNVV